MDDLAVRWFLGQGFSREAFGRMSPEGRIEVIRKSFPAECLKDPQKKPPSCFKKVKPVGQFLHAFPASIQSGVLTGLNPWPRSLLFHWTVAENPPEKIAALLLQIASDHLDQVPLLITQVRGAKRRAVLGSLQKNGEENAQKILDAWEIASHTDPNIRSLADIPETQEALSQMPQGEVLRLLGKSLKKGPLKKRLGEIARKEKEKEREKPSGKVLPGKPADFDELINELARKQKEKPSGARHNLPNDQSGYADLKMRFYHSRDLWSLTGRYFDQTSKTWRNFRYLAAAKEDENELWIDGEVFSPTPNQRDFITKKVLPWVHDNEPLKESK